MCVHWPGNEGERGESCGCFLGPAMVVCGGVGQRRRVWLTVLALTGSREAGKGEVNHPHTVPRLWPYSPRGRN